MKNAIGSKLCLGKFGQQPNDNLHKAALTTIVFFLTFSCFDKKKLKFLIIVIGFIPMIFFANKL
jgi:hypothetical protein